MRYRERGGVGIKIYRASERRGEGGERERETERERERERETEREREMYGQSKAVAMPWALGA